MNSIEELEVIIEKLHQLRNKQEEARAMADRAMLLLKLQLWFAREGKGNTTQNVRVIMSPCRIPGHPKPSRILTPGFAVGYVPREEAIDWEKFVAFDQPISA